MTPSSQGLGGLCEESVTLWPSPCLFSGTGVGGRGNENSRVMLSGPQDISRTCLSLWVEKQRGMFRCEGW